VVEKLTVGAEVGCSVLVPETVEPDGFSFLSTGGRKINQGSTRVLAPSNLPEKIRFWGCYLLAPAYASWCRESIHRGYLYLIVIRAGAGNLLTESALECGCGANWVRF
jgi:hypothetical protein